MSIQSQINRIAGNVTAALTAIGNKGVTVPSGSDSDDLATLIGQIPSGLTYGWAVKKLDSEANSISFDVSGEPQYFICFYGSTLSITNRVALILFNGTKTCRWQTRSGGITSSENPTAVSYAYSDGTFTINDTVYKFYPSAQYRLMYFY